jgi:Na+/H+ antiporter NhaD/arsenite permease-like protein
MLFFFGEAGAGIDPNPWAMVPFAVLLLTIAVAPFVNRHGWERHYAKIAAGLGLITLAYYFFGLQAGGRIVHTAVEYAGFVALIGSLFVVAGGIHIEVPRGTATPFLNAAFLAVGALLANVVGTTGASMLLIRPWIRLNKGRIAPFHVVFFIFLVSNLGGCLTPVGDPPLFLGYLKGIPFFWTFTHLWAPGAVAVGLLLAVFLALDLWHERGITPQPHEGGRWGVTGGLNFLPLAVILGAIFLPEPWREGVMIAAALASYYGTSRAVHAANGFDLEPMREVAWLFAGIFATMTPALDFLQGHADALNVRTPGQFYWITGGLSGVLDNAPTYLTFLTVALGLHGRSLDVPGDMAAQLAGGGELVRAISAAAVFFGAMTYIGNGPNFMVRSIAERAGVAVPGFFGYVCRYAVPFLLPVLFVIYWIFFRA